MSSFKNIVKSPGFILVTDTDNNEPIAAIIRTSAACPGVAKPYTALPITADGFRDEISKINIGAYKDVAGKVGDLLKSKGYTAA